MTQMESTKTTTATVCGPRQFTTSSEDRETMYELPSSPGLEDTWKLLVTQTCTWEVRLVHFGLEFNAVSHDALLDTQSLAF